MRVPGGIVARGILAGIVAATAMAAWFLLIDTLQGQPFHTPAFLARVLTGGMDSPQEPPLSMIMLYTLLHYIGFMLLGVGVSWLLDAAGLRAGLLLGFVIGFILFDIVFYASVGITGVNVVRVLGWPQVLLGNLLAGALLALMLQREGDSVVHTWRTYFERNRTVREGVIAGIIGAVTVALWFGLFDMLNGRALFTPAALGSALFYGASSPDQVQMTGAAIAGYTIVHFAGFLLLGLVAAALVNQAERTPPILLGFLLAFVTFEVFFMGMVAILASWILEVLAWWTVATGNLLAAGAIAGYLWAKHPALHVRLRQELEEPA
jgi:hypothetical protein